MGPNFHLIIIYPSSIIIVQHPKAGTVIDIHPHHGGMWWIDRKRIFRGGRSRTRDVQDQWRLNHHQAEIYVLYYLISWSPFRGSTQLNSAQVWSGLPPSLSCLPACLPVTFLLLYALLYYFVLLAGQCNYPSSVGEEKDGRTDGGGLLFSSSSVVLFPTIPIYRVFG